MNYIRKFSSSIDQASTYNVTIPKKPFTNPFVKNNVPKDRHKNWDNVAGLYLPLEGYPRYRKEILKQPTETVDLDGVNESRGRKRFRDTSNDNNYETYRKKRVRDSYDDYDDSKGTKKPRLDDTISFVQYAIKQPSQYSNPNRKILENLFEPEIMAEGWRKINDRIEYHSQIRGRLFYEMGNSIDDAREHVAETALNELCNFERVNIVWPERLLSFRLDQEFADKIQRMVKIKFNEIMERYVHYKSHKVLASIVMTNGMSLDSATVVAIGTGTKCVSNINDDEGGTILHDMHAEVLARRSFVLFLFNQLNAMMKKKSSIFQWEGKEIRLKDGLKFHLYINAIPCGDARVFSLPGLITLKLDATMGELRVKKIGGTEPISENSHRQTSMSCSDKICRWNVLGLQGKYLVKFIKPIYLESVILGSKYKPSHLYRAMGGRLSNAFTDLSDDYNLHQPLFEATSLIESESFCTRASMEHGICWTDGDSEPEILNLHTGCARRGRQSMVSKFSIP